MRESEDVAKTALDEFIYSEGTILNKKQILAFIKVITNTVKEERQRFLNECRLDGLNIKQMRDLRDYFLRWEGDLPPPEEPIRYSHRETMRNKKFATLRKSLIEIYEDKTGCTCDKMDAHDMCHPCWFRFKAKCGLQEAGYFKDDTGDDDDRPMAFRT